MEEEEFEKEYESLSPGFSPPSLMTTTNPFGAGPSRFAPHTTYGQLPPITADAQLPLLTTGGRLPPLGMSSIGSSRLAPPTLSSVRPVSPALSEGELSRRSLSPVPGLSIPSSGGRSPQRVVRPLSPVSSVEERLSTRTPSSMRSVPISQREEEEQFGSSDEEEEELIEDWIIKSERLTKEGISVGMLPIGFARGDMNFLEVQRNLKKYLGGDPFARMYIRNLIFEVATVRRRSLKYDYIGLEPGETPYQNFEMPDYYVTDFQGRKRIHTPDSRVRLRPLSEYTHGRPVSIDEAHTIQGLRVLQNGQIVVMFNEGFGTIDRTKYEWMDIFHDAQIPIPYIGEFNYTRDDMISILYSHRYRGPILTLPEDQMIRITKWLLTRHTAAQMLKLMYNHLKQAQLYFYI